MLVPAATPAGCQVNTELPNKVQKGTDMARNTVNNMLTTSKHQNVKVITAKGVSKIHPPLHPAFHSWTPNNPPAGKSGSGLCIYASLDGAPPGF